MKYSKSLLFGAALAMLASCSDNDSPSDGEMTAKERKLCEATVCYVNNTVLPTYGAMADAAVELLDLCEEMQRAYEAGALTVKQIEEAGKAWKLLRKSWELSEAFLFGPAGNHNIDPHIDSWPLDKAAMDNLLSDIRGGKKWSLENNGGYGLIGFHAIEYLLFELSADGSTSHIHSVSYTPEELEYLCAVAEDLCQQCVCLEACWAGSGNLTGRKQEILAEAELDYDEEYGWEMMNAGQPGSHFKTYQEAAEEIIQGCIDIADEVGNTKIGRPHIGSTEEDRNYIESPYSLNSIEDFADNIRSIRNAYAGSSEGDASVSDYIRSVNPALDSEVLTAISDAISAISKIPEPFARYAGGSEAESAIEACDALVSALEKAYNCVVKE